jgi:hypothetical protein
MRVEDRLDGVDNFRSWKHRVLILEENELLDHIRQMLPEEEDACYRTVCRKGPKLESGLETGVTGASPPTVTSMGSSFYLGGQVQGRRP